MVLRTNHIATALLPQQLIILNNIDRLIYHDCGHTGLSADIYCVAEITAIQHFILRIGVSWKFNILGASAAIG